MRIGPGMPSQIARAYGVQPPQPKRPALSVGAPSPAEAATKLPSQASRLISAVVPGKVSFAGDAPTQEGAIALYRHPADRNAAATGVHAGKTLDITA